MAAEGHCFELGVADLDLCAVAGRVVFRLDAQSCPEFGDPLASAQVDGDARKSVSTTRSVFFLLR